MDFGEQVTLGELLVGVEQCNAAVGYWEGRISHVEAVAASLGEDCGGLRVLEVALT